MKRISLRFTIAVITFFIGIAAAAIYFFGRANSVADVTPKTPDCYPPYSDNFDASDYKGVLTRSLYAFSTTGAVNSVSNEEISAEITADLFRRFREIPLTSQPTCADESYRLTWIPTFHAPTVIRIWRSNDRYFIVTKRLNGKGGYELGELGTEETHTLSVEQWQSFRNSAVQASFWKTTPAIEEMIPNDGATWAFEGYSDGKFHSVIRITPSDELSQLFRTLFDLSGVETEYERYL